MSSDRYDDHHMSGAHLDQPITAEEGRLMNMTSEQRTDYINRLEHASAVAAHKQKEAQFKAKVDAATEVSLAGNHRYQEMLRGQSGSQRATIANGKTTFEQLNQRSAGTAHFTAPQALVDQVPVTIGGSD